MAQENLNFRITAIDKTRQAFASVRGGLDRVKSSVFNVRNAVVALGGALALRQFAQQIDDIAKQSRVLGFTVSQLQELQFAASQSGVSAAELETGFRRFSKSISEASTGLSTPLKAFEALGVTVTNTDGSLRGTQDILNDVANSLSVMASPADKARIAMDLFGRSGAGMVNMLGEGTGRLNALREQFSGFTVELTGEQAAAVEAANDRFDLLRRIFNSIGQQITATLMPAFAGLATTLTTVVIAAIDLGITAVRGFLNAFIALYNFARGPKLRELEKFTFGENFQDQIRRIVVEAQGIDVATKPLQDLTTTTLPQGFTRTATATEKARDALNKYGQDAQDTQARLAELALNGVKSLENGLVDVITGTKKASEAFKSMASSIISDLIRMQIQKGVTGQVATALSGFFGGPDKAAAIGGSLQRGGTYLVGERGPELFQPNASGTVIPNDKMGGGGVVVNQTINVTTGVQQTVRTEIASLMPQIAASAKSAVLDAKQRGGSFSKAF